VAVALGLHPVTLPEPLDHGAMVPLTFLWRAGWRGPTAILSLPWDDPRSRALGERVAALPGRTAVIASGDMSHRLQPDAPAGFHPRARAFDEAFVAALEQADWDAALAAPWREEAAEDVVESTAFAMGAAGLPRNPEVIAYEGPFGVGYTEAVLHDERPPLYAVARQAIHAALRREPFDPPTDDRPAAGVFVTLHRDGALRGCVGSIVPQSASLSAEVARMAPEAALADDRFAPVTLAELPDLHIDVSVLEPPEEVADATGLDPARFGVIMTSGWKRALLLPDIDGIDTVERQLDAVRRKAGIRPDAPVRLERFSVRKEAAP
jgi:AmmeMemoRadiSam system protein A